MDNKYAINKFLDSLYEEKQKRENLLTCQKDRMEELKKTGIEKLRTVLQIDKMEQTLLTELNYEKDETLQAGDFQVDKYSVSAIRNLLFPVYVVKPAKSNGKSIIYLHGHDPAGVMGALRIREDKVPYHKNAPLVWAKEGYTVFAPEEIGFGEAIYEYTVKGEPAKGECFYSSGYLAICGYNLAALRVLQTMKTLDFAQALGYDADTLIGISGGGMICEFTGVLDDRIQYMAVASYTNTYQDSILAKEQCVDNYVPGIMEVGDSHEILALAAPKKLLSINGIWDRPFPEVGSRKAFEYLQKVYERFGVSDNFHSVLFQGKHEMNIEEVTAWLKTI